jgi:hypothetical protein
VRSRQPGPVEFTVDGAGRTSSGATLDGLRSTLDEIGWGTAPLVYSNAP